MPGTTPDVRTATAEDAPDLVALYRRSYGENEEMGFPTSVADCDRDTVDEWLRDRGVLVAALRDELVGAVQVIPRPDWGVPEIGRLAVRPERRERGIGRLPLESAEARVRAEGHARVRLRTLSDHPFLGDWYRRDGYERIGIERLDDRPYDAPILEKRL